MSLIHEIHLSYIQSLVDEAIKFFKTRTLTTCADLVVFDIDGTVIDDTNVVPQMKGVYQGYAPMLELYATLLGLGYKVIFLTARAESFREITLFNLEYAGYKNFDALVMMPYRIFDAKTICEWKDKQRRLFKETLGYNLVACIGDQDADTTGNHIGEYQIRIPPPPLSQRECSMM